jgi:anti-anti-sigma regulatory factor
LKLNLFEIFKTNTLRHRDTAETVIKLVEDASTKESVVIDFQGIVFVSRSFSHELQRSLENCEVTYVNMLPEIDEMMQITHIKPRVTIKELNEAKKLELATS